MTNSENFDSHHDDTSPILIIEDDEPTCDTPLSIPRLAEQYIQDKGVEVTLDGYPMPIKTACALDGGLPVLFEAAKLYLRASFLNPAIMENYGHVIEHPDSMLGKKLVFNSCLKGTDILNCLGPISKTIDVCIGMSPEGSMEFTNLLKKFNLHNTEGVFDDLFNAGESVQAPTGQGPEVRPR